jgi:hypothetical protein
MGIEMRCVGQHLTRDLGIVDERTDGRQMCCAPQSRREVCMIAKASGRLSA